MNMNESLLSIIDDAKLTLDRGWCRMYSIRGGRGDGSLRFAVDKNWRAVHPVIDSSAVRWTVEGALLLAIDRHSILLENRELREDAMKVEILHGNSGAVLYSCDAPDRLSRSRALGAAARRAIRSGISLRGAQLDGAHLADANLSGAHLDGAKLMRATLARANLMGATLARANLTGANLTGANLVESNLAEACLFETSLARADFGQANFANASLGDNRILDGGLLSDGKRVFLWWDSECGWRIRGGCWDVSLGEAEWRISVAGGLIKAERLAMLAHLRRMAKVRGWDLSETVE